LIPQYFFDVKKALRRAFNVLGSSPPRSVAVDSRRCRRAAKARRRCVKKRDGNFEKRCESAYEIAAIL